MNARLNNAIERLLLDDRFLRRFRRNPERALEPFDLTDGEIEAVKLGDAGQLIQMGLDPKYVWPTPREGFLHAWVVRHAKRLTPALVLAAFVLPVAPALAAKPGRRASRRAIAARFVARAGSARKAPVRRATPVFRARTSRSKRAGG